MSGPIASAVVLPEPDEAPPNPLKRARENGDDVSAEVNVGSDESRPAAPKRRERGRERRLFGAVLGALSQNPTTAGQQRRSEIEKRQQARRRQEDDESEQRKAERLAARRAQRWKEQRRFEREAMAVRHANMLHRAHFLCTVTEPQLHYQPWELSSEEQDRIDDQIAAARRAIQREIDEYERDTTHDTAPGTTALQSSAGDGESEDQVMRDDNTRDDARDNTRNDTREDARDETRDHDMRDEPRDHEDTALEAPLTQQATTHAPSPTAEVSPDEPTKDADEEVVEAAEDTVIY